MSTLLKECECGPSNLDLGVSSMQLRQIHSCTSSCPLVIGSPKRHVNARYERWLSSGSCQILKSWTFPYRRPGNAENVINIINVHIWPVSASARQTDVRQDHYDISTVRNLPSYSNNALTTFQDFLKLHFLFLPHPFFFSPPTSLPSVAWQVDSKGSVCVSKSTKSSASRSTLLSSHPTSIDNH